MKQQENNKIFDANKTWWSMDDLTHHTGKGRKWIKENILEVPRYKEEIQQFAHYAETPQDRYIFVGSKMKAFLEDNFMRIMR
ncbi:DUF771 domain-containing protein [Mammaliicoccus sciuri]|uniref:DUF771 domain-containing protein n=1 Tax=Mammaliicoccus sciuri TaxID=1296 RepID=UPI0034DCD57F